MIEHRGDLVRHGIGVDRHWNCADHLRRGDRPVEPRAVRANDGDRLSPIEADGEETDGDGARLVVDLGPGPRLPEAEILMTKGGAGAPHRGMRPQKLGERVVRVRARGLQFLSSLDGAAHILLAPDRLLPNAFRRWSGLFNSRIGKTTACLRRKTRLKFMPADLPAARRNKCAAWASRSDRSWRNPRVQPRPCFWRIALVRRKVGEGRIAASGARSGC